MFLNLNKIKYLVPRTREKQYIKMWVGDFFTDPEYVAMYKNMLEQHFIIQLFSNPGDKIKFAMTFYEARISEFTIIMRFLEFLGDQQIVN